MMLRHLGLGRKAAEIENALLFTLEQGIHTGDFGDKNIPSSNTTEFIQAIIRNLGKKPQQSEARLADGETPEWSKPKLPDTRPMWASPKLETEKLVGCDLLIDSEKTPEEIAEIIESLLPDQFRLLNISNRGTQVWPSGSVLTECVNHHGCRIILQDKEAEVHAQEIWAMIQIISNTLFITSMEMLRNFGEKQGYSLAQGQ